MLPQPDLTHARSAFGATFTNLGHSQLQVRLALARFIQQKCDQIQASHVLRFESCRLLLNYYALTEIDGYWQQMGLTCIQLVRSLTHNIRVNPLLKQYTLPLLETVHFDLGSWSAASLIIHLANSLKLRQPTLGLALAFLNRSLLVMDKRIECTQQGIAMACLELAVQMINGRTISKQPESLLGPLRDSLLHQQRRDWISLEEVGWSALAGNYFPKASQE